MMQSKCMPAYVARRGRQLELSFPQLPPDLGLPSVDLICWIWIRHLWD